MRPLVAVGCGHRPQGGSHDGPQARRDRGWRVRRTGLCRKLAGRDDVRVTLVDKHNYHQFQPLFYQVATCQLAHSDVAVSLRKPFRKHANVAVGMGEVTASTRSPRR